MSAIIVGQLTQRVRDADGWLTILDNINFSLAAGASLAIVGASGSGKSTLLGLMAGLDQPSTGQVKVFGTDLFAMNEDARAAWRAKHVGFVFQTFQLLPQMSALENVMLPLELSGAPNARARAQALLKDVGLEARFHHYPRTLSGGEQQRVALARAFVAQPALLFADEPTGSLDSATGERVIELMLRMNQQHQTTLILVTHDEALAARCDRQLRLTAGRIESLSPEPAPA
jgi:putative ABC transport system ATP-binding protein